MVLFTNWAYWDNNRSSLFGGLQLWSECRCRLCWSASLNSFLLSRRGHAWCGEVCRCQLIFLLDRQWWGRCCDQGLACFRAAWSRERSRVIQRTWFYQSCARLRTGQHHIAQGLRLMLKKVDAAEVLFLLLLLMLSRCWRNGHLLREIYILLCVAGLRRSVSNWISRQVRWLLFYCCRLWATCCRLLNKSCCITIINFWTFLGVICHENRFLGLAESVKTFQRDAASVQWLAAFLIC